MQADDIKALLQAGLQDCEISVNVDGSHVDILAIGEIFAGLRAVKKQQLVYAILNEAIANGSIHAVNIRTYTPSEWQEQA